MGTRIFRNIGVVAICLVLVGLTAPLAHAEGLKKVVAVSRFENKTSYAGGGQFELDNGLADQLTDALIQSGQFTVLERETLTDVISEQDLAQSGRFQKSKSARTGKLTSAQVLIKGTITEFETKSSGSGSGIGIAGFKVGSKRQSAHVGLIVRLIDTTTGEVLDSERVEGTAEASGMKFGVDIGIVDFGTDSFKKTPLGKATQIAIDNAVEFISAKLKDRPFQGRVVKCSEGDVIISAGDQVGASVGDTFTVYSVGEELVDPETGELLGVEEDKIGSVKIYQVKQKYSKAKLVSGGKGIKAGDIIRSQ
jgi:curli biogenesis system outer membrane secretion channel CsgG